MEVYAYQFGWIVRYSGVDNTLEKQIIKWFLQQPIGCNTQKTITETYNEIDQRVNDIDSILSNNINAEGKYLLPDSKVDKLQEELDRHKRRKYRIEASIDRKNSNATVYESSNDDIIVQEIHLVKNQPYTFKFRSKDVIHCPWFPHLEHK